MVLVSGGDLDRRKTDKSRALEAKLMVLEAEAKRLMGESKRLQGRLYESIGNGTRPLERGSG